ncbi:MAG: SAM-dependent chlorinase/fluorinase [Saprospiraceae bacterium]|nr:SAM-dependent chlorinase/fluorinase [Saprospiraceae bacterium]
MTDHYIGMIKGSILSQVVDIQIVDITHYIEPHNIVQAAYILKNCYHDFPSGSIHIVSVNNRSIANSAILLCKHQEHYFIVPDNGILSLMLEEVPFQTVKISIDQKDQFIIKNLYATIVRHLHEKGALEEIGQTALDIEQRIMLRPVVTASQIRGSVIYIDHYENVIVNIQRSLFEEIGLGRSFQISFKRHEPITHLSTYYYDVPIGEVLCLFNSAQFLEIAVNMGKAAKLLGLSIDDTIQIDFKRL